MDGKGIFKTVKTGSGVYEKEKQETPRAAEAEKVGGASMARQEIKAPERVMGKAKEAEKEASRRGRLDRQDDRAVQKVQDARDAWMDEIDEEIEQDIKDLDEMVKDSRTHEEEHVLPTDRTKDGRQSVKTMNEKEKKTKGTEDVYLEQQARDYDSVKSGNQVGSVANERVAVEQTLDVYGIDGFEDEHDEILEDIGAKEVSQDDQEEIQKAEKAYYEEDDDLEAMMAADTGDDIGAEETKTVYIEEEEEESRYPEINEEDVFDKGMERKAPWES